LKWDLGCQGRWVGVSAYRRIGVSACRRVGVSACRRVGVSACRRVGVSMRLSKLQIQGSILLKKAGGFQIVSVISVFVGASIESEHNDEMLAENERNVWVSERTFLCRMHMTRS
jgi:hypothetical protein